jgi:hypothetical protein
MDLATSPEETRRSGNQTTANAITSEKGLTQANGIQPIRQAIRQRDPIPQPPLVQVPE